MYPLLPSDLFIFDMGPDVLDGAMVTLAIFTLNFFHPGFLLGRREPSADPAMKELETPPSTSHLP